MLAQYILFNHLFFERGGLSEWTHIFHMKCLALKSMILLLYCCKQ